jgi:hypothetical protein
LYYYNIHFYLKNHSKLLVMRGKIIDYFFNCQNFFHSFLRRRKKCLPNHAPACVQHGNLLYSKNNSPDFSDCFSGRKDNALSSIPV